MPFAIDLKFIYEPLTTNEEKSSSPTHQPELIDINATIHSIARFLYVSPEESMAENRFVYHHMLTYAMDDKTNERKKKSKYKRR